MFKRKLKYEVVPESEYTDFSDRYEKPSVNKNVLMGAGVAATASLATMAVTKFTNPTTIAPPIPLPTEAVITPVFEPTNVLSTLPELTPVFMGTPEMIPTGLIAESSLNMLANVLDPVIQILVAISFPIASVIMIGACFFFMFGKDEKAWTMIMNSGLGYILIQMSPLFLEILRQVGKAI